MRLVDLNPSWFALESGGPVVGLSFECPHCRTMRLGIALHHKGSEAMEDEYIMARSPGTKHIWDFSGSDFNDISLSPSVDASEFGHWHGHIKNGEVT